MPAANWRRAVGGAASAAQAAGRAAWRLPFAALMLAWLGLVAFHTGSHLDALSRRVVHRVGFAPRDLLVLDLRRLVTSAVFTDGGWSFWSALAMIALAVGTAEWLTGTRRATLTFWGVHLVTLLAESLLVALPLQAAGVGFGSQLSRVRDVGPSAGYFGALGLACAALPRPWAGRAGLFVMAALAVGLALPPHGESETLKLSADIAHVIAFPLGWWSWRLWPRRRAGSAAPSHATEATGVRLPMGPTSWAPP